jgi:flagellar biosynthetic protein FliQ
MDQQTVVFLVRRTLMTGLLVVAPLLLAGMTVGVLAAIFQAVTSIRDTTLNMIPKILAVAGVLVWMLPWILNVISAYTADMLETLRTIGA